MLTGQAKKDYQREYMRQYRQCKSVRPVRPTLDPIHVRPLTDRTDTINNTPSPDYIIHAPMLDADGNPIYDY